MAQIQANLGCVYARRMRGERAENREKSIAASEAAPTVIGREPQEWGNAQWVLGMAYGSRIRGTLAENLETAIGTYHAALTIFTREANSSQWAGTSGPRVCCSAAATLPT